MLLVTREAKRVVARRPPQGEIEQDGAAVAIEMPKAMRLMRTGFAAISASAPWSWDTAMMARPMKVRER